MKSKLIVASAALALITSCSNMENPLLTESAAPFGAPEFDKISNEHYLPAFEKGIEEAKAEIDAIVANQEEPTFENTIAAMDRSGRMLSDVSNVFGMICAAETNDTLQQLESQIMPQLAAHSDAILMNEALFARVKAVYEQKDKLTLTPEQAKGLAEGHAVRLDGCRNKEGQTFSCYVQFDAAQRQVVACHPAWLKEAQKTGTDLGLGQQNKQEKNVFCNMYSTLGTIVRNVEYIAAKRSV